MSDVLIGVAITILKGLTFVYDVVSYIPFMFIDNPQEKVKRSNRIKVGKLIKKIFLVDVFLDDVLLKDLVLGMLGYPSGIRYLAGCSNLPVILYPAAEGHRIRIADII